MLRTPHEDEKQKCRKIIAGLEKELRRLQNQQNPTQPNYSSSSNFGSSSNSNINDNSGKDEKINQLEGEIEHLKKNKPKNPLKK